MGDRETAAYYRGKATECFARAEALADPRDAKLHRAFARQFEQEARILENNGPVRSEE
jgi:hypothetical protein